MNESPTPTPAERLTELSLRLSAGAEAWGADNQGGWLPAALIALIITFIKEIAESLASLAALVRDGKLVPQPPAAPRQRGSRPGGTPNKRAAQSPALAWPTVAPSEQMHASLAEPDMAALPAVPPEPTPQTPRSTSRISGAERPASPKAAKPPPAPKPPKSPPSQAPFSRIVFAHWTGIPPISKKTWEKPPPWHALNVTKSK